MDDYDVLANDAVIHVYMTEGFLRRHRDEISEKDAANLEIATRIFYRYTSPSWRAQHRATTNDAVKAKKKRTSAQQKIEQGARERLQGKLGGKK